MEGLSNEFDILIFAVPDTAIKAVAYSVSISIPHFKGVVAHTAGSIGIKILEPLFKRFGVFYPLQTFSKDIEIEKYEEIPVFIEGNDIFTTAELKKLATEISNNVYNLDSTTREKLHIASVFACNFVNGMYLIAEDILKKENIPFNVIHALVKQTASKAISVTPFECQTGPARRDDKITINKHLQLLESNAVLYNIYKLMSEYIINKYYEQDRL